MEHQKHHERNRLNFIDDCNTCREAIIAARAPATVAAEAIAARDKANALPKPKEITPEQLAKHLTKKSNRPKIEELM